VEAAIHEMIDATLDLLLTGGLHHEGPAGVSCKVLEQKLVEFGVREARLRRVERVAVVAVSDAFEHE
jgi:hypothetical protein